MLFSAMDYYLFGPEVIMSFTYSSLQLNHVCGKTYTVNSSRS